MFICRCEHHLVCTTAVSFRERLFVVSTAMASSFLFGKALTLNQNKSLFHVLAGIIAAQYLLRAFSVPIRTSSSVVNGNPYIVDELYITMASFRRSPTWFVCFKSVFNFSTLFARPGRCYRRIAKSVNENSHRKLDVVWVKNEVLWIVFMRCLKKQGQNWCSCECCWLAN